MRKTVTELLNNNPSSHLWFVRDKNTNQDIFAILLECRRKYNKTEDENIIDVVTEDVEVETTFYMQPFTKWARSTTPANEELFYHYIDKFENIRPWLKCVYEPKWKEALGEEFFDAVTKYIKNDLYLFCCSFDNVCAYESTSDDKKEYIKE